MKNLLFSLIFVIASLTAYNQEKPKASIISTFDDKMTYYYYGNPLMSTLPKFTQQCEIDFNCNKYIIDYIKARFSYKFDFVEFPAAIPIMAIGTKFNSIEVDKKSSYLIDSLKNHNLDYVIYITGMMSNPQGFNNSYLAMSGWGMVSDYMFSTYFAYFGLGILDVRNAVFGESLCFDASVDAICIKTKRVKKKDDFRPTDEELSSVPAPVTRLTKRILDEILPKWQRKYN